jgi:hypothetical protein
VQVLGNTPLALSPLPLAQRLRELMSEWPDLTAFGLATGFPGFESERAALVGALDQVAACMALLADAPRTRRPRVGSYGLKHAMERALGRYVSNGSVIAAALLAGIPIKAASPPNALLGIRPGWATALKGRRTRV